jgi:methylamine---glutamate N-methyltransferase subunit C
MGSDFCRGSGLRPLPVVTYSAWPAALQRPLQQALHGPQHCLLAPGWMWEGARVPKCLALGANAVGLGRAALIAVDTGPGEGLVNLGWSPSQ